MGSNIKRSTQCFITRWNTSKIVKNTCWCRIFNSLLGFSSGDETRRLMLDILLESLSIRKIKFNVFFLIEVQNLMLCFWQGDLNKPLDLRVVSCQKLLVKLHVSHLNECLYQFFFLRKGSFYKLLRLNFFCTPVLLIAKLTGSYVMS